MKSELTPGWNIFKQIFHDHWDELKQFNPRYDHAYYDELVNKMLACGNPEQIGYLDYRCLDCGQGQHLVAMSCKSALCLRCAKVYVDDFVRHVSHNLHEGGCDRSIPKIGCDRSTPIDHAASCSPCSSCPFSAGDKGRGFAAR